MTKCKPKKRPKRPRLNRLRKRALEVDFEGGTLTSDGGLVLLREVDKRLNLISRIAQIIPDPRDPRFTVHSQQEILASRIFGIAAGYEDVNDQAQLRHDPAFQVAAEKTPAEHNYEDEHTPLASPSTHSRFENRIDSKTNFELHRLLVDVFLNSFDKPPEEIVLDYDATDDPIHGNQEGRYFNGFYDGYCFLPLYVFCGDQLLVCKLSESRFGAAHHSRAITKLLVKEIRARWPEVRIIIRGDSGFANESLMKWCDKNGVRYVLGLQKNAVLERNMQEEMAGVADQQAQSGQKETCFKWFRYKARSWHAHRWVVGKAEHSEQGPNPRFVVTNLPSTHGVVDPTYHRPRINGKQVERVKDPGTLCSPIQNPELFYRERYCMRGEMENRIKEQQMCLFADRTSCTRFVANQFRLLLSSFAYVLVDGLRRLGLKGTKHARLRVDTIRLKLFKLAARVRVTCRRVVFHLPTNSPSEELFKQVLLRLSGSG